MVEKVMHERVKCQCIRKVSSVRKPKLRNTLAQRRNVAKGMRKQYENSYSNAFTFLSISDIHGGCETYKLSILRLMKLYRYLKFEE